MHCKSLHLGLGPQGAPGHIIIKIINQLTQFINEQLYLNYLTDIIRLSGDAIRLIRLGDNIIKLTRLGDNIIRLIRLGDNIMKFIRLGGNIIRLSVEYWENLGCSVTIKKL
jgi:hypothetical protein